MRQREDKKRHADDVKLHNPEGLRSHLLCADLHESAKANKKCLPDEEKSAKI